MSIIVAIPLEAVFVISGLLCLMVGLALGWSLRGVNEEAKRKKAKEALPL